MKVIFGVGVSMPDMLPSIPSALPAFIPMRAIRKIHHADCVPVYTSGFE